MKKSFLLLSFFTAVISSSATDFESSSIKKDIYELASDKMEGRGTGEKGCEMAAAYLSNRFKQMGLLPMGDDGSFLKKFVFKVPANPHGGNDSLAKEKQSANVIAFIDNKAQNTIVIGAHYDHLGLGNDGNSLDANPKGKIHNGADDNASGVSGVLALADFFNSNKVKEQNNFMFICFTGEELGLFGSKKFCENAPINLKQITCMLNMDMIGRLDSLNRLLVYGVGTSPDFVQIVNQNNRDFVLKLDSSGIGPSDHTSFYLSDIPVLHFFTGQHSDYHKPSDDADKINFEGEKKILEYMVRIVQDIDSKPKLAFTRTRNSTNENSPKFKVTLGIMPDYVYDGKGVRVDGVTQGRPAANAGILKGDIIVQLGDIEVKDLQSYMQALSKFSKGDAVNVVVQRGSTMSEMEVVF